MAHMADIDILDTSGLITRSKDRKYNTVYSNVLKSPDLAPMVADYLSEREAVTFLTRSKALKRAAFSWKLAQDRELRKLEQKQEMLEPIYKGLYDEACTLKRLADQQLDDKICFSLLREEALDAANTCIAIASLLNECKQELIEKVKVKNSMCPYVKIALVKPMKKACETDEEDVFGKWLERLGQMLRETGDYLEKYKGEHSK
eukprot:1371993-Prymnesium_polylepis.1